MFSKYVSSILGVEYYAIGALIFFFVFFLITFIWAFHLKSDYLKRMESLPLDEDIIEPVSNSVLQSPLTNRTSNESGGEKL